MRRSRHDDILSSRSSRVSATHPNICIGTRMWRIELLGGIRATCEDRVVSHFETRRAASLLAFLACHRKRPHPREVLAEMLWPDEDMEATRDRLRQALSALRRALEPEGVEAGSVLQADRSEVSLAEDAVS